ncbi:MAG: type-F conjugative transfer system pilin assembly protein TrbC [Rhodocyclaceae bacterium]|nr:type-F conjugative transfer system pilin assembly protein TrbC [Rhodocyclaceae bacterium]
MGRISEPALLKQRYGGAGIPSIESVPKPAVPAPDIAELAQKYKALGRPLAPGKHGPDLLVMVSLSMPRDALVRLADQAERAGAVLVFRGLKGDSMRKMGEEIKALVGDRNVSAVVHPPAFQQFSIKRVPVVVITRPDAGSVLDSGCSRADTFVKVSGDVSLDYALEYIERTSPAWADVARSFRSKIIRGIN